MRCPSLVPALSVWHLSMNKITLGKLWDPALYTTRDLGGVLCTLTSGSKTVVLSVDPEMACTPAPLPLFCALRAPEEHSPKRSSSHKSLWGSPRDDKKILACFGRLKSH